MFAIETFALEKTYYVGFWRKRPKLSLRPLTIQVREGEVFGYLGPNGAGKTTTLKLLMGLVFPTSGSAKILGMDVGDPRMKAQIGFLPEHPYFYDYLTAHELLDYYARLSGVPARDRKRAIEVALDRVKLTDIHKVQLRKFSKGMLQRVGIAQAIIHDPKLVFLDEPMSGLDPIGRREVRDLMQELKDQGKTIFFSTHILSDAETICDRVAVLNKGELKGVGVVADLSSKMTGTVEFQFEGSHACEAMRALGAMVHATGESVRAQLPEARQDAAIDTLRRSKAKLLSITPLRATLEDYFLGKLNSEPAEKAEAVEVGR